MASIRYSWQKEWQDELKRRKELKLPRQELAFLEEMRREKRFGKKWLCVGCSSEYRVKTPFLRLYCPICLRRLRRIKSLLPPSQELKKGYWILEE